MAYPKSIQDLIEEFSKFPSIGPKSAERFVFYLLQKSPGYLEEFLVKIRNLKEIKNCSICGNITEGKICAICTNQKRDRATVCVVANVPDLIAIEKIGAYNGFYHVLGGLINSIKNIGPDNLRIKELVQRIKQSKQKFNEIILALNPDLEGETTSLYLKKILIPFGIKITKLARGLPMGADLIYADEVTLSEALKARKAV